MDVQTDKRRDPVKLLTFTGAHPGIKVLDMGAGGGHSTELMARAVARAAAKKVKTSRSQVYVWKDKDPVFAAKWIDAVATGLDILDDPS